MFKRNLLSSLILTAAAIGAHAADGAFKGTVPPSLKFAETAGSLEVIKSFPATAALDGWVVKDKNSGKNLVVFTTKDGETLLAGLAMDKTGKNLTSVFSDIHVPGPDYSAAMKDFAQNGASVTVGAGSAKAEITVVFDANCGFCKVMHKLVAPAVAAGELKVHYIPVAILGADSDVKGAGVMASKNPLAALDALANGGTAQTSNDKALLAKIQANGVLMKKHGFSGTPAVLYMGKQDGEDTVFAANGVPNIMEMFSRLGISGQVATLKKDPSLARFLR